MLIYRRSDSRTMREVTVVFRYSLSYVYIGVHITFIPALLIHISDLLRFLPATAKGTSSRSSLRPKVFTGESEFSMSLYPPDSVPLFNPAARAHCKRRRHKTQPGNLSYWDLWSATGDLVRIVTQVVSPGSFCGPLTAYRIKLSLCFPIMLPIDLNLKNTLTSVVFTCTT